MAAINPVTIGIASSALSALGGMFGNAAIAETASKQYEGNKKFIERDQSVMNTQLLEQAEDVNRELGANITAIMSQFRQEGSQVEAKQVESNVFGNTAQRAQAVLDVKEALSVDNITQAAESKMLDVQSKLMQVKYDTEKAHAQNAQSYNNMMSQQQSTFEIIAGSASAGLSGYSMGLSFENTLAETAQIEAKTAKILGGLYD